MPLLKVVKLPTQEENLALTNTLLVHPDEFRNKNGYLQLTGKDVVYASTVSKIIDKGTIGISGPLRSKHKLAITPPDVINVEEYQVIKNNIDIIVIHISCRVKPKFFISVHEDEIKDLIKKKMKSHFFHDNQMLLLEIPDNKENHYVLNILSVDEGYITDKTTIELVSKETYLNVVTNKLLKRDLFKDDYNFEEIGIGGLDGELVNIFRRALSTRAYSPSIIQKLGIKHVKGILLYGPPGTGKTLIARKIGGLISKREPVVINGPEILNKYVGQSEENIRTVFKAAEEDFAKNGDDADLHIIIFDEIDAICKSRGKGGSSSNATDSIVNQLLTKIDGFNILNNIFLIAMTNRKDLLDPALLRAGRIEVHIEIKLPDRLGREQIFRIHTNQMQINHMLDKSVDIPKLATLTENYSGAEIEAVVKNASSSALHDLLSSAKENINDEDVHVTMNYFLKAVDEIIPIFGNVNKAIDSLLPTNFVMLNTRYESDMKDIASLIHNKQRLKTILLHGENGSGKTSMAATIAHESKVKYTKFIRAIDMLSMDEYEKAHHISNIIYDAYISSESLIVIDDVEILINYANLDHSLSFSNRLYQTLMTILKTSPNNKNNRLTIVVTSVDKRLSDTISNVFDKCVCLKKLKGDDIKLLLPKLKMNEVTRYNENDENGLTIKQILT